jgi:hypothetical protein
MQMMSSFNPATTRRPSGDMATDQALLSEILEKYMIGELDVPSDEAQSVSITVKMASGITHRRVLVTIHIPHAHRPVVRAGNDEPAVRRERE